MPKKVDVNPKNPPDFPDTIDDLLPYMLKHENLLDRMLEVGLIVLITNGALSVRDEEDNLVYDFATSLLLGLSLTYLYKHSRGSMWVQLGVVAMIVAIISLPIMAKYGMLEEGSTLESMVPDNPHRAVFLGPLGNYLVEKFEDKFIKKEGE